MGLGDVGCFRLGVGFAAVLGLCGYAVMLVGLVGFVVGLCFFWLLLWAVMGDRLRSV